MSDIPSWVKKLAEEFFDKKHGAGWTDKVVPIGALDVFAAYIAEHEQPPVDPLLLEAREIVAKRNREAGGFGYADAVLAGVHDNTYTVELALEGLRRGAELGKAQA